MTPIPPTVDELRAAFDRCRVLHLLGWTFAKALAVPSIATSHACSAICHRQARGLPAQPDFFTETQPS